MRGGWTGKILRIDLSKGKSVVQDLDPKIAVDFLGGRGFAIKTLWDELPRRTDPLSPQNLLILATGPLTGISMPSSGKLVVAAKSPLTGGYGDGNIGTRASVQMKKAGYDAVIISGKAEKPSIIVVEDGVVEIKESRDLWGLNTYKVQEELEKQYGRNSGILVIGRGGERLVKFAVITSEKGRAGGRPGIGAVMGSKNLKAIVIKGSKEIPLSDPKEVAKLGADSFKDIKSKDNYDFWIRQGTMATVEWANANAALPTYNMSEGVFDGYDKVGGTAMEKIYKIGQKGCPNCNMPCGNINAIKEGPYGGRDTEVDYENIAMLGPNLGIDNMNWALNLNLFADENGIDTISLGNVLAFATEAMKRGLVNPNDVGVKLEWGDGQAFLEVARKIVEKEGFGSLLAEGVAYASQHIGKGSERFAMHVKGLEISAYDCHAYIGMALAYGTSPIGAHHKDAWFISYEIREGRGVVSEERVKKLIWMQNVRGGFFESAAACRLPWVEVGYDLEWYPKFLKAATGLDYSWDDIHVVANRIYTLIRAFWIREKGGWSKSLDTPPAKWFEEP
ncbi:MAG: aldehyde ferredoxin oxidoreductase family protein, partial [Candidatus Korarchaeum sp.]|nr:aldehyde ferredoxin oxidoreductase family protein [Candidatus Korarchaeum sp.]MDW8035842.1 aldehyde ferredoxin oxidoreductase family protein [Candidatus Korarchaeum sp.]